MAVRFRLAGIARDSQPLAGARDKEWLSYKNLIAGELTHHCNGPNLTEMVKRSIEKVVVLGAGTMGARIAAHVANAGVWCALLDIVPRGA